MKKILKNIFVFLLIGLISCNKDVEIQSVFDFDFKIESDENGYVFEESSINVDIIPENIVEGVTYHLTYEISEGKGILQKKGNKKVLKSNESPSIIDLDSLFQQLSYFAQTVGMHYIDISVEDSNGMIHTKRVEYESQYVPFNFLFDKKSNTYPLNTKKPVSVTLVRNEGDEFNFNYQVSGGNGTLFYGDTEIEPFTDFTLPEGISELYYFPTTLGEHTITATTTSPDGDKREASIIVDVTHVDFDFTATVVNPSVKINELSNIVVELSSNDTIVEYEITHTYNELSLIGELISDTIMTPGIYKPIEKGTYTYTFSAPSDGLASIVLKIRDSNGQIKEQTITINVEDIVYTFIAEEQDENIFTGQPTNIYFDIDEPTPSGTNYEIKYIMDSGSGELKSGSQTKVTNTWYPISTGASSWNFVATDNTNVNINFIVRNKTTLSEKEDNVRINVDANDFELNLINLSGSIRFNETAAITGSIIPDYPINGTTYEAFYTVSGGEGIVTFNNVDYEAGEIFAMDVGSFNFNYTPTSYGGSSVSLTLNVTDNNGKNQQKTIYIGIESVPFNFTAVEFNNSDFLTHAITNNVNISGNSSGMTYQMSFTGGDGTLKYGTTNYIEGQWFSVPKNTTFTTVYYPNSTSADTHTITVIVKDNLGEIRQRTLTFDIYKKPVAWADIVALVNGSGGSNGDEYGTSFAVSSPISSRKSEAFNGATIVKYYLTMQGVGGTWYEFEYTAQEIDRLYSSASYPNTAQYKLMEFVGKPGERRYFDYSVDNRPFFLKVEDSNGVMSDQFDGYQTQLWYMAVNYF